MLHEPASAATRAALAAGEFVRTAAVAAVVAGLPA
jgi:hypothetical protein